MTPLLSAKGRVCDPLIYSYPFIKAATMQLSQRAFTLWEILISLSIVIMTSMIVLPTLKQFVESHQDELLLQQLLTAISLAKSAAKTHHVPVSICQSNNQTTCGSTWEKGQLVFVDRSKSGVIRDSRDLISIFPAVPRGNLHWHSFQRYKNFPLFLPTGFGNNNGTFWYCRNHTLIWAIRINKADRVRVSHSSQFSLDCN